MGIAAGGKISQTVIQDDGKHNWDSSQTKWFNVQIVNSQCFQQITGLPPPVSPVSPDLYTQHGYPFFRIWEELSHISGAFGAVRSIGEIDGIVEPPMGGNVRNTGAQDSPAQQSTLETPLPTGTSNVQSVEFFQGRIFPTFRSRQELEREMA
jgi:hypothetical protein